MTIYNLYVKTHSITGLKYLGYTKKEDPHAYYGSGIYWKRHLKKHGYTYTTEILLKCQTVDEIKKWGPYYSTLWNIVKETDSNGNKIWANEKPETGDGGSGLKSKETREKIRAANAGEKNGMYGKTHSKEARNKIKLKRAHQVVPKRSEETKAKQRAKRWYTDGVRNIKISGEPPNGFISGRTLSAEIREKFSAALRGQPGTFLGKTHSLESREKIRKANIGNKNALTKHKLTLPTYEVKLV